MDDAGFVLSRPHHTLSAFGARQAFADVAAAQHALHTRAVPMIVGAIPFLASQNCALIAPETYRFDLGPWTSPTGLPPLPRGTVAAEHPAPAEHMRTVEKLLAEVADKKLDKVVAARSVVVECEDDIHPLSLLARLVELDHVGNGFCADLSPAGGKYRASYLVGASPETLIRKTGTTVSCWPLAGSAARSSDPAVDESRAQGLLASEKNQHEHAFVVEWMRERLAPLCSELRIEPQPALFATPEVWHLGTPISGELRDPATTALDLALTVHPTPAVCGTPHAAALRAITQYEGDRGFYAGAVGWCDASGDGEWMVAIRCAEVQRRTARAYAGGGIVRGSDPAEELAETTVKLRTLLSAFSGNVEKMLKTS
ncbi:isochorismate synthase [Hoyosella sp. YIM 151337]|uniref:isochorismate synthase n=1 Tax=Hoyosella sp. YIM 151337 TaxID=2992742 RepID=UPI002235DD62|nr:isochorismate synthase [Hoyosella sp. YIM 151337]MCW4355831.1 isochorismate synthase [Hoyosella sp. YIM 151337]